MGLLDAITNRKAERHEWAQARYWQLVVAALADDDEERHADELDALLLETGRTVDTFRSDLGTASRMRDAARLAADVDARRKAADDAEAAHLAACAARQAATAQHNAAVAETNGRKVAAQDALDRAHAARRDLAALADEYPDLARAITHGPRPDAQRNTQNTRQR